ncbi:hypothetical protein PCAR4_1340025 [Paraburkholderia caribensis]|nr:hypothetical protein PCAR4_1340025 [Paraburkholderia caribensis]
MLFLKQPHRDGSEISIPSTTGVRPRLQIKLIGREAELRKIFELLDRCRIVTLVGIGGVGKSKLAAAVANEAHQGLRSLLSA